MPTTSFELLVANDLNEVARISNLLSEFWSKQALPQEAEFDATLALEEILSNVIRHGCEAGREYEIRVRFATDITSYQLEISDNAMPYNPLLRPDPDLDVPIEQRRPGGLGVFLVKKLADDLRYEYRDGHNVLTFRKKLPSS